MTKSRTDIGLHTIFALLLALRVGYPFWHSPLEHINNGSMPGRQWRQAGSFWDPHYMAGVDSFFYQPWLASIRFITADNPTLIQLYTGLLCAALPLCWYGCARQLLPVRWALMVGIAIALTPSLWTIYAYFASETLLLPLIGLACLFTARCYRQPHGVSFVAAGFFWGLAAFTRLVALPPGAACMLVLLWRIRWRLLPLLPVLLCWGALYMAACWHSMLALGYSAPFGVPELNAVLTRSDAVRIRILPDDSKHWFRSPALSQRPLEPFSDWSVGGLKPMIEVPIDTTQGKAAWDNAMQQNPPSWKHFLTRQIPHNVMFILFGSSWPEVWPDSWNSQGFVRPWEMALNHHARWMWAPLIVGVFIFAMRYPMPAVNRGVVLLTLGMVMMMAVQYTAVFEGRYRKPVEPLLILSAALIGHARYGYRQGNRS